MKKFSLPFVAILAAVNLSGCFYQKPMQIYQPSSAANSSTAIRSPDPTVWRSDPTRVTFQNYSQYIHMKIWVGRNMTGAPDLELGPEEGRPFNFPGIGVQTIYIAGQEATNSGWKDLGVRKRPIDIYTSSFSGGSREIPVGDWDFAAYYYRPSNSWRW